MSTEMAQCRYCGDKFPHPAPGSGGTWVCDACQNPSGPWSAETRLRKCEQKLASAERMLKETYEVLLSVVARRVGHVRAAHGAMLRIRDNFTSVTEKP